MSKNTQIQHHRKHAILVNQGLRGYSNRVQYLENPSYAKYDLRGVYEHHI